MGPDFKKPFAGVGIMYPTPNQMKALKQLEAALKQCKKENVFLHNCYATLHAFDGNVVFEVNDDPSDIDGPAINEADDGDFYSIPLPCCEWTDDTHYIHLRDGVNLEKYRDVLL